MLHSKNRQKGFAAFLVTILVLMIMFGIAVSLTALTVGQERISGNIIKSTQSYYMAEAGIEDALLRLAKNKKWVSPYVLGIPKGSSTIDISDAIGGTRTIISEGNINERIRKLQVVYQISTDQVSFYYGAQVGEGGMVMGNNSRVKGNVFSNGNVIALGGRGFIDDSVVVANNGNRIEGLKVGKDAQVHTCKDSEITDILTYVAGGSVVNCTAGGTIDIQPNEILPKDLPISQAQINSWKNAATTGGILYDDFILDLGVSASLGPKQIGTVAQPKNLVVTNNSHLKVTGTIYVTGDIEFSNNSIIELDPDSYGSTSGVIVADGKITIQNNVILRGSGESGSYILILSTNDSLDPASPAVAVNNNAEGAIFYAGNGLIWLGNNMIAREISGYKVQIENNAEVQYESGLEDSRFSSGTGGFWEVASWREIK